MDLLWPAVILFDVFDLHGLYLLLEFVDLFAQVLLDAGDSVHHGVDIVQLTQGRG